MVGGTEKKIVASSSGNRGKRITKRPSQGIIQGINVSLTHRYAELIDSTYSWCFLFILGFNMILISLIGIQVKMANCDLELFNLKYSIYIIHSDYYENRQTRRNNEIRILQCYGHGSSLRRKLHGSNSDGPQYQYSLLYVSKNYHRPSPSRFTKKTYIFISEDSTAIGISYRKKLRNSCQ